MLYALMIDLPAGLDDVRAGFLASAPCDPDVTPGAAQRPLSGAAARRGNDHRGDWTIRWLFQEEPDRPAFAALLNGLPVISAPLGADTLRMERVEEAGWLERSYRQFEPFRESGFYIYGSHIERPAPETDIPLLIDAATAFGSGEHRTTAGCLALLSRMKTAGAAPRSALDMGTGSGILAIAAWKLWGLKVDAVDIDPEAVRVAARHRTLNRVPEADMPCLTSEAYAAQKPQHENAYDLVIANILARPLIEMADSLVGACKPGGFIILSGMLEEQVPDVLPVYRAAQCTKTDETILNGWSSLLLRRD